jgi:hypothetical protein
MNMGKITLKWMKISVLNRRKNEVQTIQDFSDSMGILRAAGMQLQETALSWWSM